MRSLRGIHPEEGNKKAGIILKSPTMWFCTTAHVHRAFIRSPSWWRHLLFSCSLFHEQSTSLLVFKFDFRLVYK